MEEEQVTVPILRDEIYAESAAEGISPFLLREYWFGSIKQDWKKQAKERGNPRVAGKVHLFHPVPVRRRNHDEPEEPHSWYLPYPDSKNGAYILQNNLTVPHRRPPHFFIYFESTCLAT